MTLDAFSSGTAGDWACKMARYFYDAGLDLRWHESNRQETLGGVACRVAGTSSTVLAGSDRIAYDVPGIGPELGLGAPELRGGQLASGGRQHG